MESLVAALALTASLLSPTPAAPSPMSPTNCTPKTNSGNCYEPGQMCRKRDRGSSGISGDGEAIKCQDNNGWRWEPQ